MPRGRWQYLCTQKTALSAGLQAHRRDTNNLFYCRGGSLLYRIHGLCG